MIGFTKIQDNLKIGDKIIITDEEETRPMEWIGTTGTVYKIDATSVYLKDTNTKFTVLGFIISPRWWAYEKFQKEWDS